MVKKRTTRRRSTRPIDTEGVIELIRAVTDLDDLKWEAIAAQTSYNERSIRRIDGIYQAFWDHKDALSSPDRKKPRSAKKIESETISYLRDMVSSRDKIINELKESINDHRKVFVQLVQIADKQGIVLDRLWLEALSVVMAQKSVM